MDEINIPILFKIVSVLRLNVAMESRVVGESGMEAAFGAAGAAGEGRAAGEGGAAGAGDPTSAVGSGAAKTEAVKAKMAKTAALEMNIVEKRECEVKESGLSEIRSSRENKLLIAAGLEKLSKFCALTL